MAHCSTLDGGRFPELLRIFSVGLVVVLTSIGIAVPAAAQNEAPAADTSNQERSADEFASPTPEQKELNDQAVQALTDENYAKAVSYLEEALYIGELNVSYLNLGRAYQKMGECRKAKKALQKVAEAPRVAKPPPEFVASKAEEYLKELPAECPAPGETGKGDGEQADIAAPPRWPVGVVVGGGFVLAGGGLALFAANTIRADAQAQAAGAPENGYERSAFRNAERRANTLGAAGVATAAVGAVAIGVGVYFLVSDKRNPQPTAFAISPSRDGAQATFRISF